MKPVLHIVMFLVYAHITLVTIAGLSKLIEKNRPGPELSPLQIIVLCVLCFFGIMEFAEVCKLIVEYLSTYLLG